jgi:hypothetical protein
MSFVLRDRIACDYSVVDDKAMKKRRAEARLYGRFRHVRPDTDAPDMEGTKDTKILLMMSIHPVGCLRKPPRGIKMTVAIMPIRH